MDRQYMAIMALLMASLAVFIGAVMTGAYPVAIGSILFTTVVLGVYLIGAALETHLPWHNQQRRR